MSFKDTLNNKLNTDYWNTLRSFPNSSWLNVKSDGLQISGGQSPQSNFEQHLIGTRQTSFNFVTQFNMQYDPRSYLQLAGGTLYLDTENYLLVMVSADDNGQPIIVVHRSIKGEFEQAKAFQLEENDNKYHFVLEVRNEKLTCRVNNQQIIENIDVSFLAGGFTGNFIGLDVIDMERRNLTSAVFSDFEYTAIQ
ncbi:hypothetical protein [Latilactobacillus sakei]|uniref:beta-xylosidase family glycoside hydrolase n=1 Tax=Latilactobacillus sakei TaxID=1599 RepID=UPI00215C485E|nr:hypothetical protein [Latilactobacillus sakei]